MMDVDEEEFDVVVIGGGIGGAALGMMLSKSDSIRFAVFEKDVSFSARSQGYGLTIQHHSAMETLGGKALEEQIRDEDTVNDAHFIFGPQGELCSCFGRFMDGVTAKKKPKNKRYNVHLPRQRLRELLVDSLEQRKGALQWGWRLESLTEQDNHEWAHVTLCNDEGARRRLRARVVVGADGIHSVVRKEVMRQRERDDPLQYLGMLVVLGMTPTSHALCLRTTFQTLDGSTRLFTMPFTVEPDATFWQLSFPCPEAEANRLRRDLPALRAELERRCADWHAPVPDLLRGAPADMITATPVYDRGEAYPFLRTEASRASCVTLIGDAAHPMSPFKGQGANQALLDAVAVGEVLLRLFQQTNPDVCAELAQVERQMYLRSDKKVRDSKDVAVRLHSSTPLLDPATRGISEKLLEQFSAHKLNASTPNLRKAVLQCLEQVTKE